MNISSFLGVCFGIAVMYSAMHATAPNLSFFLDFHGILIVCGGTAAAASISFSLKDIFMLFRVFIMRVLGQRKVDYQETISILLDLNKKASTGVTSLSELVGGIKNDFLKEGVALLASGVLTEAELRATLEQRLKTIEKRYLHEANMFRTIGRFPPAFGLLATTLGMIGLLQKIGQPDSQKLIGPAMSVGLIGTLYGVALANLVFIPIAENLTERTHEEIALRKMIVEGVVLLKHQVNPYSLRERLNSYVLPRDRVIRKVEKSS